MIVAIERSNFTNLFKFGVHTIGFNNVLDVKLEELSKLLSERDSLNLLSLKFEEILPIYEQDHEVLILEVDKAQIGFKKGIEINFNSVKKIFPLSKLGQNLLFGKLNANLKVENPIFEEVIENAKILREVKVREFTVDKLFEIFKVPFLISERFREELRCTFLAFSRADSTFDNSFIFHLLTFNKNLEWFIKGNSEYFQKIACITAMSAGKTADSIQKGTFVSSIKENFKEINSGNALNGYSRFMDFLQKSTEFDTAFKGLNSRINPSFDQVNLFKVSYFYFAIKSYLETNDQDLTTISQMIYDQIQNDPQIFSHVLYLTAFTFSHEQLYNSIHELDQAPVLLKNARLRYSIVETDTKPKETDIRSDLPVGSNINRGKSSSPKMNTFENQEDFNIPIEPKPTNLDKSSRSKLKDASSSDGNENNRVVGKKDHNDSENTTYSNQLGDDEQRKLSSDSTYLTVRDFRRWVKKSIPSSKKVKNWENFIQNYFSVDDERITEERLLAEMSRPNVKESDLFLKSGKNKFNFNFISSGFFNK